MLQAHEDASAATAAETLHRTGRASMLIVDGTTILYFKATTLSQQLPRRKLLQRWTPGLTQLTAWPQHARHLHQRRHQTRSQTARRPWEARPAHAKAEAEAGARASGQEMPAVPMICQKTSPKTHKPRNTSGCPMIRCSQSQAPSAQGRPRVPQGK